MLIGSLCANLKKAPPLGDAALWVHVLASRAGAGSELLFVPLVGCLCAVYKLHFLKWQLPCPFETCANRKDLKSWSACVGF